MMVMNPIMSDSRATPPGTSSLRKLALAASMLVAPAKISTRLAVIICTPWLVAMAKIRKGTRISYNFV